MKTRLLLPFLFLFACLCLQGCQKTASGSATVFSYETESAEEGGVFKTHIAEWLKGQGFSPAAPADAKAVVYTGSYQGSKPFQLEIAEAPSKEGHVRFNGSTKWEIKGSDEEIKSLQDKVDEFTKALQKLTGPSAN